MSRALVLLAVAGCAQGSNALPDDGGVSDTPRSDAVEAFDDAALDGRPADASVPDAFVPDAFVPDAFVMVPPDACIPVATQRLVNPVFDLSPVGTGWEQTRIDPAFPLVTADDGVVEHSAPYKAWLGGFADEAGSTTDVLWQDVAVPMGTTQLVLTGYYEVRTGEATTATTAYDTASITLTRTDGTPIQVVRALSNLTPTTAWTAITHTFDAGVLAQVVGQTVRLRMTSTNDFFYPTSFFFDTLALTATHCP